MWTHQIKTAELLTWLDMGTPRATHRLNMGRRLEVVAALDNPRKAASSMDCVSFFSYHLPMKLPFRAQQQAIQARYNDNA